jgi:hypothetical protein
MLMRNWREDVAGEDAMLTDAILECYDGTGERVRARGRRWYARMTVITTGHAGRHGVDPISIGGVWAAYSQNTPWGRNMRLASGHVRGRIGGTLGDSIRKATACLAGSTIDAETKDADAFKVRNFARNCSGDTFAVTVDRWALRIAYRLGSVGGYVPTGREYERLADAYRAAAAARGETPADMQAITWIARRDGVS